MRQHSLALFNFCVDSNWNGVTKSFFFRSIHENYACDSLGFRYNVISNKITTAIDVVSKTTSGVFFLIIAQIDRPANRIDFPNRSLRHVICLNEQIFITTINENLYMRKALKVMC